MSSLSLEAQRLEIEYMAALHQYNTHPDILTLRRFADVGAYSRINSESSVCDSVTGSVSGNASEVLVEEGLSKEAGTVGAFDDEMLRYLALRRDDTK